MSRKTVFALAMLLTVLLLVPAVGAQDQPFRLTIMHTNDVHGGYAPYKGAQDATTDGGATRQAAVIKQIRAGGRQLATD